MKTPKTPPQEGNHHKNFDNQIKAVLGDLHRESHILEDFCGRIHMQILPGSSEIVHLECQSINF